jgi:hypothetical protein
LIILETEEAKKAALINALIKGEQSKRIKNFNTRAHVAQVHQNNTKHTKVCSK